MTDRLDPLLRFHPFTRLNALLQGIEPGHQRPLLFSVGEPQQTPPAMIREPLVRNLAEWGRYPLAVGNPEFRRAAADWLNWRFHLPATAANGFLPEIDAIPEEALARAAFAYVCSPANPQGAVADPDYLKRWIALGRKHGFAVGFDECYAEIYRRQPPPGALAAAAAIGEGLEGIVCFHSLSKRSGGAGLRSGFIAGDEKILRRVAQLVNYGGVAVPLPIIAASTALWQDEAHVAANRAAYNENFALARRLLGNRFVATEPAGGFFLWLDVGDGEAAARRLWAEAGLKVLPGGYMAQPGADGRNPGAAYIRVALVHDRAVTADGLTRMSRVLQSIALDAGGDARKAGAAPVIGG
jgi:aspartate/methionine/tyrosine aminotransferase